MGCVSAKSSYEIAVDDFFAEMTVNRSFAENFNVLNSTLPQNGEKISSISQDDFETKIIDTLLVSKNDTYRTDTIQFWIDNFKQNFSGQTPYSLFYLFLSNILLTKDLNETNFFKAVHRL